MLQAKNFYGLFVSVLFASALNAEMINDGVIVEEAPSDLQAIPLEAGFSEPLIVPPEEVPVFEPVPLGNISLDMTRSLYVDPTRYPGEDCNRICQPKDYRICYFKFTLEHYQAMGVACGNCSRGVLSDCEHPQCILGDGVEKGIMSINRKVPGPPIQVCKNDKVVVDVFNNAHGTAAGIHWHGLHMRDTPHMDGVPFVTQCPIPFATTFRYDFRATEAGTQFYHGHAGQHKVNGQYGAFIVREPPADVINAKYYDFDLPEHHILLSDWTHPYGEQIFPGLPSYGGIFPDSLLINGRGSHINSKTLKRSSVPPTRYYVQPGKRYRFRVINSVSHACTVQLQIEKHNLTIIATDSHNVKPSSYDTLVSNGGERFDFVLDANHTHGDFWIRLRGMGLCFSDPTDSLALLRYVTNEGFTNEYVAKELPPMPEFSDTYAENRILNHPHATCLGNDGLYCITDLQAEEQDDNLRYEKPHQRFHLAFTNRHVPYQDLTKPGTYPHFANIANSLTMVGSINNISLTFPSSPPLTQPYNMVNSVYCDEYNLPQSCPNKDLCYCVHRLKIRRNAIVELVLVDETETNGPIHHPYHLHGFRFMVTNMGQHPDGKPMTLGLMRALERQRRVPETPFNPLPPFKDTISIPSRGFATVRFRADNPGFWLMHCHYELHLAIGMGLIVQVDSTFKMVKPPTNFPKCGDYLPSTRRP